jgi:hypothetical protein
MTICLVLRKNFGPKICRAKLKGQIRFREIVNGGGGRARYFFYPLVLPVVCNETRILSILFLIDTRI